MFKFTLFFIFVYVRPYLPRTMCSFIAHCFSGRLFRVNYDHFNVNNSLFSAKENCTKQN